MVRQLRNHQTFLSGRAPKPYKPTYGWRLRISGVAQKACNFGYCWCGHALWFLSRRWLTHDQQETPFLWPWSRRVIDECFVRFDNPASAPQRRKFARTEGFANAMRKKSCAIVLDAKDSVKLMRTNSFLDEHSN
jgi:hypothetical protein